MEGCDEALVNPLSSKIENLLNTSEKLVPQTLKILCTLSNISQKLREKAFQALAVFDKDDFSSFVELCLDESLTKHISQKCLEETSNIPTLENLAKAATLFSQAKIAGQFLSPFLNFYLPRLPLEGQIDFEKTHKKLQDATFKLITQNKIPLDNFPCLHNLSLLMNFYPKEQELVIKRLEKLINFSEALQCLACLSKDQKDIEAFKSSINKPSKTKKDEKLERYFPYALIYGGDSVTEDSADFLFTAFLQNCREKPFEDNSFLQVLAAYENFPYYHCRLLDFYLDRIKELAKSENTKTAPKPLILLLEKMTALYATYTSHSKQIGKEQRRILDKYQKTLKLLTQHTNSTLRKKVLSCMRLQCLSR